MTVGEGSAKWSNAHTVLAHRTMRSAHLVRPQALPMQFTPVVPARVLRPWDFEVVHPKDLAPLTGVKGRDLIFRARVLRAVLALLYRLLELGPEIPQVITLVMLGGQTGNHRHESNQGQ